MFPPGIPDPNQILAVANDMINERRASQYPHTGEHADWVMKSLDPDYSTTTWQTQRDAWIANCKVVKINNPHVTIDDVNSAIAELDSPGK